VDVVGAGAGGGGTTAGGAGGGGGTTATGDGGGGGSAAGGGDGGVVEGGVVVPVVGSTVTVTGMMRVYERLAASRTPKTIVVLYVPTFIVDVFTEKPN
jgi:hypothetical protein